MKINLHGQGLCVAVQLTIVPSLKFHVLILLYIYILNVSSGNLVTGAFATR